MWLILALVCASTVWAAEGLTPKDVFELEQATDPQISPDGRRVVYVRGFADVQSDTRYSNLWIVNVDGTDHRPLTTGNFNDTNPRWSPDGGRLLYISTREGGPQIWTRWMDTGQTVKVTSLEQPPNTATWSPDGKQIAFFALAAGAARKIGKVPAAPSGAKWAEPFKIIDRMVYRYDQVGYLKEGWNQLFVVPADGRTPRQVSSGDYHHDAAMGRSQARIAWTPDSRSILLSANRTADAEFHTIESDVWEFDVATGAAKQLTRRNGPDGLPTVSPDGRYVAYSGFDDRKLGYQVMRLYLMNRDGSGARLLTGSLDRDAANPQWASDGSGLYFMYADQGNNKLAFEPIDGPLKTLAANMAMTSQFSVAKDGTVAAILTRPDLPGDVAIWRRGDTEVKRIAAVNDDLLSQRTLGAVEEIWYESPKDKKKIQGWILKPPGFDASKKYPLILEIHGGPFSYYGDRFDLEKQMMAAAGYVVLYTNPRGSTSYGEAFGNLIHHDYPGNDFDDLNAGVDAVIAKGYIDQRNLFVTGGSGGGVLTAWVVGHTTRFRAAASLYPVINWYSFIGTADIGAFVANYWFPGNPWDHVAHYEKRSLLSVVKNVKTPVLIMTGEEDYRTPISESEQYYRALKLLKVEAVLVRAPGEPHGISRRPSHHAAKIATIVGWFDEHRAK